MRNCPTIQRHECAGPHSPQNWKHTAGVDRQKVGHDEHLRRHVSHGHGQQASGCDDHRQLGELSEQRAPVLQLHGATVETARAIQARHQIGRQGQQHARRHQDKGGVKIRDGLKSQHRRRREQMRSDQHQGDQSAGNAKINPQHRCVKACGPAVAIDAGLKSEKPVDRTQLQASVRDENEISGGVNGKPGGQHIAGPVMQENGNQRDLLGHSQDHLEEIGRPSGEQSSRAAWPRGARQRLPSAVRRLFDQG